MIGIIADALDLPVVRELFELFKTPWEPYERARGYEIVLCFGDRDTTLYESPIAILYAGVASLNPATASDQVPSDRAAHMLRYKNRVLPLYSGAATFTTGDSSLLCDATTHAPAIQKSRSDERIVIRVGYDLLQEVRFLLTSGQPPENASTPTLDLHISLLRDLLRLSELPFVEVPPVPAGHRFVACLTHDVDHPYIRKHKLDHTTLGFLYRAVFGSMVDLAQGRTTFPNVLRNWIAAVKLPLVHLGLADDVWSDFDLHYSEIERGHPSTFFVIPFRNTPGITENRSARGMRGSAYGAADVAPQIQRLILRGCEIGLHGIDAWTDSAAGKREFEEIGSVTRESTPGVRMHWLFFEEGSPLKLEQAGAKYDSTVGYNETIGYRAGTHQVYKPLNTNDLVELPLHIMDTALFYPSYLHLAPADAGVMIQGIIESAAEVGGCVTVNWHDRSIAPERLWTDTYVRVIDDLEKTGAWFATASQATSWFRMRRSIRFERDVNGKVRTILPDCADEGLPPPMARAYAGSTDSEDIVLAWRKTFVIDQPSTLESTRK